MAIRYALFCFAAYRNFALRILAMSRHGVLDIADGAMLGRRCAGQ
jgi:hypothetical protein